MESIAVFLGIARDSFFIALAYVLGARGAFILAMGVYLWACYALVKHLPENINRAADLHPNSLLALMSRKFKIFRIFRSRKNRKVFAVAALSPLLLIFALAFIFHIYLYYRFFMTE